MAEEYSLALEQQPHAALTQSRYTGWGSDRLPIGLPAGLPCLGNP